MENTILFLFLPKSRYINQRRDWGKIYPSKYQKSPLSFERFMGWLIVKIMFGKLEIELLSAWLIHKCRLYLYIMDLYKNAVLFRFFTTIMAFSFSLSFYAIYSFLSNIDNLAHRHFQKKKINIESVSTFGYKKVHNIGIPTYRVYSLYSSR